MPRKKLPHSARWTQVSWSLQTKDNDTFPQVGRIFIDSRLILFSYRIDPNTSILYVTMAHNYKTWVNFSFNVSLAFIYRWIYFGSLAVPPEFTSLLQYYTKQGFRVIGAASKSLKVASQYRKLSILNQTVFLLSIQSQNYKYLKPFWCLMTTISFNKTVKKRSALDMVAKQISNRIRGQVQKGDWGCPPF